MSLYGYKAKTRPAPWTQVKPQATDQNPKTQRVNPVVLRSKPQVGQRQRKRVPSVSKGRQRTNAQYRKESQQFVEAVRDMGGRCPVVERVPELRNGRKYGHPICDRVTEVHHQRGRTGSLLLDKRGWIAVSKQGHRWVHQNVQKARELGFICDRGLWGVPF
jgi:hypothetical protein